MKTIIIRESEFQRDKSVLQAKLGQKVDGKIITNIVIIPEWVIQAIEAGRIK